ncbi:hypothetical protein NX059_009207 [Plenodomus lindquistii]|nr:hypothetical protein NX059_009207 [Plenodomus lindquistii]
MTDRNLIGILHARLQELLLRAWAWTPTAALVDLAPIDRPQILTLVSSCKVDHTDTGSVRSRQPVNPRWSRILLPAQKESLSAHRSCRLQTHPQAADGRNKRYDDKSST